MASVREFKKGDPSKGFIVDYKSAGERQRRLFRTKEEAADFCESLQKDRIGSEVLIEHRSEFLLSYERCQKMGVTLDHVVDFYAKHGKSKTNPALEAAIESLLAEKRESQRKATYIESLTKHYDKLKEYVGASTPFQNITAQQLRAFIYKEHAHTNATTKRNLIRNLSVLFNYAVEKHYTGINPLEEVDKPKPLNEIPKVLSPEDFQTLLNRCLERDWDDRIAVFLLVGFCGVRTQEASQLEWANIDLKNKKVLVPASIAKKGNWRRNEIPPNAMEWFLRIEDKRRHGPIIGTNWVHLLRTAVKFSHISHTKNCLRHSYCSYALEAGWPVEKVVASMGHWDTDIAKSHYRNVVETESAKKWWSIVPPPESIE
jgi:integrase